MCIVDPSSLQRTSASLLARLAGATPDQEAWSQFVQRYGRQVYRWCRKWQLQDADAQDVTQGILAKLAVKLRTFRYDPARSFRAYLKTLTRYAVCDFLATRPPDSGSGDSQAQDPLVHVAAQADLLEHLRAEFDLELLDEAMQRVRRRVDASTWEAFQLVAVEGWPVAEVARHLALKSATVYVIKGRVQQWIRDEIAALERSDPDDTEGPP
jgi:RNA polymerase sigma-70 factor (ECF subfamily)